MAEVIVSGNLNTYGNNGQFETDRSTWGFGDGTDFELTRTTEQVAAGIYSAKVKAKTTAGLPTTYGLSCIPGGVFSSIFGKRYLIKAKVFVSNVSEIADDTVIITFKPILTLNTVTYLNKTVAEAKGSWVDVEARVENTSFDQSETWLLGLMASSGGQFLIQNGVMYVDRFEIYEYIITEDPPATCDVVINTGSTVVTNETSNGAGDGSINVSATGTGTLEYSKDGSTWQPAALFTGLTTGIYVMRVRKQADITCVKEYPFALNHAAVTHDFTTSVVNESISGLHDGSITVTTSGTGGPFQFSKDGGVTWQAGNTFTGLAPGNYYVAVKNAAGNSVVKVVTVAAGTIVIDKVYHSKNPITFSKGAVANWESLTNYRLYNDVRVEDVADSGNFVSKLKVELPPDADDVAIFYLPEAFRGVFTFVPPTLNNNTIIRLTDRIKRFKNYSGELENDEVTPPEGELVISPSNLVLWGGVSKFHFPGLNYFTSYLTTNKKFLTWAPLEKYVDKQQEDYLNFWVYGNFSTLKLQIKAYFDDATNQTAVTTTLTGTEYARLYQVPAGPANCGVLAINASKNVTHYELKLLDQADNVISELRTYYIEQVRHPLTRFFMFLNSLGAFEVLRFTGQANEKTTFSRTLTQRFLPHNYAALDGQFLSNDVALIQQRDISSGFIKNRMAKEWHEYMKDFMSSRVVYDVTDGSRYPVVITGGDHVSEDQNYEFFIRVTAREAYDNDSFTPANV